MLQDIVRTFIEYYLYIEWILDVQVKKTPNIIPLRLSSGLSLTANSCYRRTSVVLLTWETANKPIDSSLWIVVYHNKTFNIIETKYFKASIHRQNISKYSRSHKKSRVSIVSVISNTVLYSLKTYSEWNEILVVVEERNLIEFIFLNDSITCLTILFFFCNAFLMILSKLSVILTTWFFPSSFLYQLSSCSIFSKDTVPWLLSSQRECSDMIYLRCSFILTSRSLCYTICSFSCAINK